MDTSEAGDSAQNEENVSVMENESEKVDVEDKSTELDEMSENVDESKDAQEATENSEETEMLDNSVEGKPDRLCRFPLGRVKHIMKMDPDVTMASQDAVFMITKATEMFLECLAKECFSFTSQSGKKTLQKHDVDRAISAVDCLAFLEGAIDD